VANDDAGLLAFQYSSQSLPMPHGGQDNAESGNRIITLLHGSSYAVNANGQPSQCDSTSPNVVNVAIHHHLTLSVEQERSSADVLSRSAGRMFGTVSHSPCYYKAAFTPRTRRAVWIRLWAHRQSCRIPTST